MGGEAEGKEREEDGALNGGVPSGRCRVRVSASLSLVEKSRVVFST